jgi:hypothetical protein
MNRHLDKLTEKARAHKVFASKVYKTFVVESASSGELYRVTPHENGVSYNCTCAWSNNNPGSECSHILAVRMSLR